MIWYCTSSWNHANISTSYFKWSLLKCFFHIYISLLVRSEYGDCNPCRRVRALSGATTPGQSGPGSNGNEGVLHIPQDPSITWTSPSDCLVSYQDTRGGGGLLSLCRGAVSVFYSPSRLGNPLMRLFQIKKDFTLKNINKTQEDKHILIIYKRNIFAKLQLMVRLQFWKSGCLEYPFIAPCSDSTC